MAWPALRHHTPLLYSRGSTTRVSSIVCGHKSVKTEPGLASVLSYRHFTSLLRRPPTFSCTQRNFIASRPPENARLLQRIWTVPNALSLARIAMAPVLSYLVVTERPVAAVFLLAACGVSDFFDGWIARRFRQQSALGSALDPLGDKLLVGTLAVSLYSTGQLPGWLLLLILGRDTSLLGVSVVTRWKSLGEQTTLKRFLDPSVATAVVRPTWISKTNTALQLLLLGLTLGDPVLGTQMVHQYLPPLQSVVAGTTIASALDYLLNYKKSIRYIRK